MNHNNGLSFNQSVVVLVTVFAWVIAAVLLLSLNSANSNIYPPLLIFSSATLLLLLLVFRLGVNLTEALKLNFPPALWLLIAVCLAVFFWMIENQISTYFYPESTAENIESWQRMVADYQLPSVALSSVLLAPVFEELYFRGLLLSTLQKKLRNWSAVLTNALLFALIHWTWPDFISLMLIGLIYGWMTIKSNSIVPALLAHIIHNALTIWLYRL